MENKKSSKFGLGLIFGSIVGAVAALFVTPKTGKQMRELAKKWLVEEVEKVKKEVGKIDKRKFKKAVEAVLGRMEKEVKKDKRQLSAIKRQLMRQWVKLKKENKKTQVKK